MLQKLKKAQAGFTIIELLIVIAIIAILAGLVLNNFQGAQAKARDTQRVTDVNNIHTKLEEYYGDNNGYPNTFTAATFPGIDADSLKDPKGTSVDINAVVADETAADAVAAPDGSGVTPQYLFVPFGAAGCTTACTGYVLKTFVEKPTVTTPNPYRKEGLNNP
ncbi:MAG: prepilin-type N-terminal cleavage/methylation domain-containing protein [Patescibacteria group bacterium]